MSEYSADVSQVGASWQYACVEHSPSQLADSLLCVGAIEEKSSDTRLQKGAVFESGELAVLLCSEELFQR